MSTKVIPEKVKVNVRPQTLLKKKRQTQAERYMLAGSFFHVDIESDGI